MVTIIGFSTSDATAKQKKELSDVLERELSGFLSSYGAYFQYLPVGDVAPDVAGQTHFTVLAPPLLTDKQREQIAQTLKSAVAQCFGTGKKVMVFFHYNNTNAVAMDGVLGKDAAAV